MIASVFSKSKPINFVIVVVFMVLFLLAAFFLNDVGGENTASDWLINAALLVFSLFLLDFINSKNNLTNKNSYGILFFGLFVSMFPELIENTDYLWSNLFIIFAFRRLISLQTRKHLKKKLFDAAFWITFAAIFNPWACLFFLLVIAAMFAYSGNDIKTIVVPILGIGCVFLLKVCFNIIWYDAYVVDSDFSLGVPSLNGITNKARFWLIIIPFLGLIIWSFVRVVLSINDRNTQTKPSYGQVALAVILGLTVSLLSMDQGMAAVIYSLLPAALITALSLEMIEKKRLLTAIITVFAILPLISLVT